MLDDLSTGSLLGDRYRIDSKLGEGGMAVVYRAFDTTRQTSVALKLLKPDFAEDLDFVRRFHREAENLTRLQHPNIVRFYELVESGAQVFMVLDFIDGPTLRRFQRQLGRPLTPGEVLGYLRPIAAALSYAHSQRVVHCDIKPANILIDRAGRVFVNDFGIARLSESATVTFSTPGTAAYMAPEQWRGGEDVSPATDIYALGVMLFELLTGELPFTGRTVQTGGHTREKVMREHLAEAPPRASQLRPDLPIAFDALLARCLAKAERDRFAQVEELVAAFATACSDHGLATEAPQRLNDPSATAVPTGSGSTTSNSRPRSALPWVIGGMLISVSLVGALFLLSTRGTGADSPPEPASATPASVAGQPSEAPSPLAQTETAQPSDTPLPRATATPAATATPNCSAAPAPRLVVGGQGRVTYTSGLPSVMHETADLNGVFVDNAREGLHFTVLDGPVCANAGWWWKVRTVTQLEGWVMEGVTGEYYLEPRTPAP